MCHFCKKELPSDPLELADGGWIPEYWVGDDCIAEPVCPECVATRLQFNEEVGDYELKPPMDMPEPDAVV